MTNIILNSTGCLGMTIKLNNPIQSELIVVLIQNIPTKNWVYLRGKDAELTPILNIVWAIQKVLTLSFPKYYAEHGMHKIFLWEIHVLKLHMLTVKCCY